MLSHLSIRDFALIRDVDLSFTGGLTVLLGETGAGKSILVDALAAAMGDRVSADVVRGGAKKCIVEATFDARSSAIVRAFLDVHELDWNDDLVCRREITANGTSRCFINDTPVQTSVARALSAMLMDFHGQHDTHGLLHVSRHREVVDASAGVDELLVAMQGAWQDLTSKRRTLDELRERARTADEDRARLQFLLDEISRVNPVADEDETIRAELLRAESSEHVVSAATVVRDLLYAGDTAAYDLLQQARERLQSLTAFDTTLAKYIEDLDAALVACKETAGAVSMYTEPEDFSQERLEFLRQRLMLLQRVARKYGTLAEAIEERQRIERDMENLEHVDELIADSERLVAESLKAATAVAAKLTAKRRKHAGTLSTSIVQSLHTMGMPSADLKVDVAAADLSSSGADAVSMTFTSNAGEPLRPLAKIASGGELSRVMLAVKQSVARAGSIGTLVFDEIDTGISGRIARHVGEVMKVLARTHQILCITHLPQIASLADGFVRVTKSEVDGATTVSAQNITHDDAVVEIARLLAGKSVTAAALDSARELMQPQ